MMATPPVPVALEQFLAVIRQASPAAQADAVLSQSIAAWWPYYRALRTVLSGNVALVPADKQACFYLFAQATLDGIAETVRCFFSLPWTRVEFSHWRLTTVFPQLCREYQLVGETQDVLTHLSDLQVRVVEHRSREAGTDSEATAADTLPDLVTRIDAYIRVLLHFLAQNLAQCLMLSDSLPEPARGNHTRPPASSSPRTRASAVSASVPWRLPAVWSGHAGTRSAAG